jgi:hypothetical protein
VESELKPKFASMASLLAAHVDELAEQAVERVRAGAPEWAEVPELDAALRSGARESILAELVAMQRDGRPPERFPDVDAEGARRNARFGVPLNLAIWLYSVGHEVQWEAWFRAVERDERDPETRRALLEAGSRFFFEYANAISRFATDEYMRERDLLVRGLEQRRVSLVRELLEGADVDPGLLDYELDGRLHTGVVAWGPEAADGVRELAARLDRRLLLVGAAEGLWWAWLGAAGELGEQGMRALRGFEPAEGSRLAIGSEAAGLEGFRATHGEALSAHRAAQATDERLTVFEDVALEDLASRDPDRARSFAARELRGLDGSDTRSRRLRETIEAYFACGQNAAAAAARLGIHEQTVGQRLRVVEERIGRTVASRRAELEIALRVSRYLDAADGSTAVPVLNRQ